MKRLANYLFLVTLLNSCSNRSSYKSYDDYPAPHGVDLWLSYSREATEFRLWSPVAEKVWVYLYEEGYGGDPVEIYRMEKDHSGIWKLTLPGDLNGTYYTFRVEVDGVQLNETPGIYAQAVGVNGHRAMVLDLENTDPDNWDRDQGPVLEYPNEAIIYELHVRDMTVYPGSGISMKGKYSGLAETGTKGPGGVATGLDHLKELGITHVHILPACDFMAVDETRLDSAQYNWGYMPINYNVPEGSYSTDPYHAEVRIREFKEMVKAFHDSGIGVIMDVVFNHTGVYDNSNFNLEVPGYYYRHREDGTLSDASACGNETASERAMMRKFMIESVCYWAREYHIDGFRFDLMGIHDIETMNSLSEALRTINPGILIYGEGWLAGDSPLPPDQRAIKANIAQIPLVSAFSDELRDGLKGSVFENKEMGFVSGKADTEESVKMGIVGCIGHPQVDYTAVNYSDAPWAAEPWQSLAYVSCHDNHTLFDKLKISRRDAAREELIAMDKLANAVVLTSQGISFIHAGAEMLRTKKGNHNSYNAPDSINQINWSWKVKNTGVVEYYKNLIKLRKQHPAFRMKGASDVRQNLSFETVENGLITYRISNNANGDAWKDICVIYNARPEPVNYKLSGTWNLAVINDNFNTEKTVNGSVRVPAISMVIAYRE